MQTEKELKERIKYLEELVSITPIRKAFKPLTKLEEAKNKLREYLQSKRS